jgi:hypothetical protein
MARINCQMSGQKVMLKHNGRVGATPTPAPSLSLFTGSCLPSKKRLQTIKRFAVVQAKTDPGHERSGPLIDSRLFNLDFKNHSSVTTPPLWPTGQCFCLQF